MRSSWKILPALLVPLALGVFVFTTGITWGLPSRKVDPYLFGTYPVWTGPEIQQLANGATTAKWDDPLRGADVDADPLGASAEPVWVNASDANRAEIVRRYRLFTYQPDEMITMMALAKMRPSQRDFDPRLYQYGGLWIYPVGGLLKVASIAGLVEVRGGAEGLTYYLDHPEAFGRFYVVARAYVVAWGLLGVVAVFFLVRRIVGGVIAPMLAAGCFVCMPVIINMAHEAKPHLPGAVLVLLAVWAGAVFLESGRWRHLLLAGALCGAAFGMVLSMLPAFAILPVIALLRFVQPMGSSAGASTSRLRFFGKLAAITIAAGLLGGVVYAVTNPYVVINRFSAEGQRILKSNFGNSTAMYKIDRPIAGLLNTASLAAEGTSPVLAVAGLAGAIALGYRAVRTRQDNSPEASRRRAAGLLLATPAVLIAVQSALIGAGKPGEFGRFLIVPDVFLVVEGVVAGVTFLPKARFRCAVLALLLASSVPFGWAYLRGFIRDSREITPRLEAAEELRRTYDQRRPNIAVTAEPAPYALPPMNLFDWQITKLPAGQDPWAAMAQADPRPDRFVRATDVPPPEEGDSWLRSVKRRWLAARISWAAKPFEMGQRQSTAKRRQSP